MSEFFSSPVAQALTLALVHFLWQGLVVVFGFWTCLVFANMRSSQDRYAASLVALVILTACPVLTFATTYRHLSATGMPLVENVSRVSHPLRPQAEASDKGPGDPTITSSVFESVQAKVSTGHPAAGNMASLEVVFRPYVLTLWFAGVMLSGARLLAGLGNVFWLRWGRNPLAADLAYRSAQIAGRLGVTTTRIFSSAHIREAAVVGFWRPVVLLPTAWLTALPLDVLEAVIAHELAHVRRYDVWVNLFQRVVETVLFYHPAVWWLSNQIRFERELCCDELAVEATGQRANYAMALERIGRLQMRGTLHLSTPFTGDHKMNLLSRVKNILRTTDKPQREPAWLVGMLVALVPLVFLGSNGLSSNGSSAVAQEREGGGRSAEAEAGPRRSPEAETGPRRSAEGDAGPRRSAEGDAPRRSAEGDAGPRRSAEGEAGSRRSAEGERGSSRSGEGDGVRGSRSESDSIRGFKPQTDREAALFQMIMQLQSELADLRQAVQSRNDGREGPPARGRAADGDVREGRGEAALSPRWKNTKEGRVFQAYDKDGDEVITLEEWLAMTNGNVSPARREIQTKRFNEAEVNGDGRFTPAEFIQWYTKDRAPARRNTRDGETSRSGKRDGDGTRTGPRDGERARTGPRDGEGSRTGPRDGEGNKPGSRDGESPKRGARDGDRE